MYMHVHACTASESPQPIIAAARYKLNMDEKVIQAGMFNQQSTGDKLLELPKGISKRVRYVHSLKCYI